MKWCDFIVRSTAASQMDLAADHSVTKMSLASGRSPRNFESFLRNLRLHIAEALFLYDLCSPVTVVYQPDVLST